MKPSREFEMVTSVWEIKNVGTFHLKKNREGTAWHIDFFALDSMPNGDAIKDSLYDKVRGLVASDQTEVLKLFLSFLDAEVLRRLQKLADSCGFDVSIGS